MTKGHGSIAVGSLRVAASLLVFVVLATASHAGVPPHAPGTVCYTPKFWCWARPAGPAGTPCHCPQAGQPPVGGTRG